MRNRRWSDTNYHFWPFTLSVCSHRSFGFMLDSGGGGEDSVGGSCHLRVYFLSFVLLIEMPPILWPHKTKIWLGRDYYWEVFPREVGAYYIDKSVHLHHGQQTHDSTTTKLKVFFVPWLHYRFVRMSYYGLSGEHVWTEPRTMPWAERYAKEQTIPTVSFGFLDFDGERIIAKTKIEEREWLRGTGWFKWLSWFAKPSVARSLDIDFSKETGRRKGSWKGGTVGHSIDMLDGELHEAAFRRYCEKHEMVYAGVIEVFLGDDARPV